MGAVIEVIEKETSGVSFKSYKYCHDTSDCISSSKNASNCHEKVQHPLID